MESLMTGHMTPVKTLKAFREAAGMTQVELAWYANISPSTLANWEQGRCEPSVSGLSRCCYVLRISLDQIDYETPLMRADA